MLFIPRRNIIVLAFKLLILVFNGHYQVVIGRIFDKLICKVAVVDKLLKLFSAQVYNIVLHVNMQQFLQYLAT